MFAEMYADNVNTCEYYEQQWYHGMLNINSE